ncbi:helix-turn-helix domain-containing protein [Gluconobacter cerinus]|nr:helix-turn-helix domain-containing protein [Gluconobacter sp. Gdi]GFE98112.1 hypothetical protein DmGdi_31850 [Gluconobacter sp. Gdi]
MARPALNETRLLPAVRTYRRSGYTVRQIARRIGISERSVYKLLQRKAAA